MHERKLQSVKKEEDKRDNYRRPSEWEGRRERNADVDADREEDRMTGWWRGLEEKRSRSFCLLKRQEEERG